MKRIILTVMALSAATILAAQSLGEFKPSDTSYGLNKVKNASRIFIAGFDVNFQVYNEKQEYKQGGAQLGGGRKGDALAEISVGLDGLDEETVLSITNQLYKDYLTRLEAKGLTLVTPDEAAATDSYEGYIRVQGGSISTAEIPGVLAATPANFEYFVKKFDKDGKAKKGGFLGNEAMKYAKISKELNDAIVASVDITVLFLQNQNAFQGSGANIKVKTNLRLVGSEYVEMTKDAKFKMKGQNTLTQVTSTVAFYHGKVGAGATTLYNGTLKNPLYISSVIEDQKLSSFARGGMDAGTKTIYGTFYSPEDRKASKAKVIPVSKEKYREGVYAAAHKFLMYHTDAFLKNIK